MARIFLSHSSKNNAAAIALKNWIVAGGWDENPFLDLDPTSGIYAGERWERALYEAADRCEAVLFLVSRDWLNSEWCLKELTRAQKLDKRLFGVLIDDLPLNELPATLTKTWQIVNLAAGADHHTFSVSLPDLSKEEYVTFSRSGLAQLKAGLDKAGLDPRYFAWPPENEPDRSPYPGLRPLEAEDAGIFFGRDAPITLALDQMRGLREAAPPRLLAILGASGAGKSSFLRAGLIPRLRRDDTRFLPLPIIRPDTVVISGASGLIVAIEQAFKAQGAPLKRVDIANAIKGGASQLLPLLVRLVETVRGPGSAGEPRSAPPALVLSIDQGEELFLAEGAREAQGFLPLLKEIALAGAPNLIVILTIRSDSFEKLQTAKALEGVRQQTFALPPIPHGAYQTIIEGAAQRLKDSKRPLKIEPALTQALLSDIEEGGGKDALPLLAFTLERLYREYGGDGDLSLKEYETLGRIKGSIQAAVNSALKAADFDPNIPKDPTERLVLLRRALIPALARIDQETGTPRRRVARMSDIPKETRGLIDCLVGARLLTTDKAPGTGETTVEPAHEALMRQWDTLQGWLNDDSAALLILEGVRSAARDWETKGRASDWLSHSSGRLEDAERICQREDFVQSMNLIERAYLNSCRVQENTRRNHELEETRKLAEAQTKIAEEQRRTAQRTRGGLIAASLLAALALAAAWFGFDKAQVADKQAEVAIRNETISMASLSSLALERGNPEDATQLAIAAWPREGDDRRPQMKRVLDALQAGAAQLHELLRLNVSNLAVNSAVFSPNGAHVLTASADKIARIWDARTGLLVTEFKGHNGSVRFAAFSPDNALIITASMDNAARIWDVAKGETLLELHDGHREGLRFAAFSPEGARVVTASRDRSVRIWDARTGELLRELKGHDDRVNSAVFSPDGMRVITASWDGTARIWDAATGTPLRVLNGHSKAVASAFFSPDGARVVTASDDGTARIWDATTGAVIMDLKCPGYQVSSAAFSPDGLLIVTASDDNIARVWNARTGTLLTALKGHSGAVLFAAFSPDGERVVTASQDKTARIWDIASVEGMDPFTVACARLGPNIYLSNLASRYGLSQIKPICGGHAPRPIDPSKVVE